MITRKEMPETIEVIERQHADAQSPDSTQILHWEEAIQAMDYPLNWGEEIRLLLAAEGKTFRWIIEDGQAIS